MRPPSENTMDDSSAIAMTINGWEMGTWAKNNEMINTVTPTIKPRNMPPIMKPKRIIRLGMGETNSSSILLLNLVRKKEEAVLAYALVMMDIMTRPGTIY